MALTLVTTSYGRPAATVLHRVIAAAKRNVPLTPVTVVVPTNSVGVATRRLLASGELGPITTRGTGLIGVSFLTVFRLAELIAAPTLAAAGRRPVSTPVVGAVVRAVLARAPGIFAPVAAHPATEEALVAAHHELCDIDDVALDVLAGQSPRAADVVRIHRAITAHLADSWYAEHDLMRAATDLVEAGASLPRDIGTLVIHLPQRLGGPAARLLRTVGDRTPTTVLVGLSGDARADAAVVATAGRLGCKIGDTERAGVTPPMGTEVWTMSDPDDEVRAVVRGVVAAMRDGVPLERMAVCYASADPYARLLHEHLDFADIPHNGVSVRALHDSVLGRALLRLLALPDAGFRRDDVFALLAAAPMLDGRGRRAPAAAWERISRRAGVVGGAEQWSQRLDQYVADLGADTENDWAQRERARTEQLREFALGVIADVDPARVPQRWSTLVRWAHRLVARYFGDERRRDGWPAFELEAARRVEAALDRLAGLDAVEAAPTLPVFRRTLEIELASARARIGRLGEGVLVGPVTLTVGAELERLFVCGLADGVFPAGARDDPLLSDHERAALLGELPLRAERADDDHRALLAALTATTGDRVLCFPRGDLRRSTQHVPSRFLLDTVEALGGARDFDGTERWCRSIASFVDGLVGTPFPATIHERDLRLVLSGASLAAPAFDRGVELARARRGSAFTRFDGNLVHLAEKLAARGPADPSSIVSATRLQLWAECPHAYFMRYVLHVEAVERPEDVVQLAPIDRGNIVHTVLDRFVREGAATDDANRLHAIVDEECDRVEAHGLAGRRLPWRQDRRAIHADVDAWQRADARARADYGLVTIQTEHAFDGLTVELSDGRSLRFRGAADRIDRIADGTLVVFDYKTGSPAWYQDLDRDNPVLGGTRLQLPIYARAARAFTGADELAPVEAYYWFVGKGDDTWIGYEVDADVDTAFDAALRAIIDGIEVGCFPAHPTPPGPRPFVDCAYCDPDAVGTGDRWREWERKRAALDMAPYRALIDGDAE
ncbi:MAG: PD-(D/E)XK nuclease family protein [Actinomycetota bacterium]